MKKVVLLDPNWDATKRMVFLEHGPDVMNEL
jgi:hypothetical protein